MNIIKSIKEIGMKYKFQYVILCILFLICTISCDKKSTDNYSEPEWMRNTYPEYDQERQVIYFKEQLRQDIKGDIAVPLNMNSPNHFNIACQFSFFNYGEDIRLFNGCKDDYFITSIGYINIAYALEEEDNIEIVSENHSEKYGDWALVNLKIGNTFMRDVFMTPLSMKAYKEDDNNSFIFIQFVANKKHMNVLFCGGPTEWIIVNNCPNFILPRYELTYDIDKPISGPGRFWHLNEYEGN